MPDSPKNTRIILLVTHYFAEQGSGVELIAAKLASCMRELGAGRFVWAASDTGIPLNVSKRAVDECVPMRAWNGLQERTGAPWPVWSPGAVFKLWRLVGRSSIVHLHDCLYMGNILAFVFAKLRRKPVIVTQHISMVPYSSFIMRFSMNIAYRFFGRMVLRGADRVAFYSREVSKELSNFFALRREPAYIPNGVDTDVFCPIDNAKREKLRIDLFGDESGKFVFLFVGRFVEKKGLPILRQLAAAVPEAHFVMVGQGPTDPLSWNIPNIAVVSAQEQQALAQYYQASDMLILPSIGEGFPLVIQEAMSTGLPAIVSARTARADPLAEQFLFSEPCVDDLPESEVVSLWTERLRGFLTDSPVSEGRKQELREFVLGHWSWNSCAEQYCEVLGSLCKGTES